MEDRQQPWTRTDAVDGGVKDEVQEVYHHHASSHGDRTPEQTRAPAARQETVETLGVSFFAFPDFVKESSGYSPLRMKYIIKTGWKHYIIATVGLIWSCDQLNWRKAAQASPNWPNMHIKGHYFIFSEKTLNKIRFSHKEFGHGRISGFQWWFLGLSGFSNCHVFRKPSVSFISCICHTNPPYFLSSNSLFCFWMNQRSGRMRAAPFIHLILKGAFVFQFHQRKKESRAHGF